MTTYYVGSDHSGHDDQACIDKVSEVLENAGHTVIKTGVNSNSEGSLGNGKGTVGVFLVNAVCLGTIYSCNQRVQGGGCDHIYFGLPSPLMAPPFNKRENLTNEHKKLGLAPDDDFSGEEARSMAGKYTVDEFFNQFDGVSYAFGESCEEVAQAILNGDTGSTGGETASKKEGSIMSGWESITDLLKPLDGEAMVVVRGDSVIIKRIYPPEATKLWVYEGINVVDDSVSISDYSPEIYNTFVVNWGAEWENQMEVSFTKHKELFGERKTEVDALYEVSEDMAPLESPTTSTGTEETEESEGGSIWDFITGNTKSMSGGMAGVANDDVAKNLLGSEYETSSTDEENPTVDVPITDEAEAFLFGLKTVGRARRKDGHKIECKVIGSKYWEVGEWCKVYLPSFNEDTIMFISKVSHESGADSEWLTSLTLVDYPPSLGSGQSNTPSDTPTESVDTPTEDSNDESSEENENNDETNTEGTGGDA